MQYKLMRAHKTDFLQRLSKSSLQICVLIMTSIDQWINHFIYEMSKNDETNVHKKFSESKLT